MMWYTVVGLAHVLFALYIYERMGKEGAGVPIASIIIGMFWPLMWVATLYFMIFGFGDEDEG